MPAPNTGGSSFYLPEWKDSYAPEFSFIGWRVAADAWWSRLGYSKKNIGSFGFSTHPGVQQTWFSWWGNGLLFYGLPGITYAIDMQKGKSQYLGYTISPDIRRKGGSKLILY